MPDDGSVQLTLSAELEAFLREQLESGRYGTTEEVLRDGLRLLAEKHRQERLEDLLIAGLESGDPIEVNEDWSADLRRRVDERIAKRQDRSA